MNNYKSSSTTDPRPPRALHLRRLRQWFGDRGLFQVELAFLAGVSPRLVRKYEATRRLPRALEAVVAMSLVLDVSIEQMIAPELIDALRSTIAERQQMLGALTNPFPAVPAPV
jgi:transcriptional regulator with XRE-family HTH domain